MRFLEKKSCHSRSSKYAEKSGNRVHNPLVNVFLGFTRRMQLRFRHEKRMIATRDNLQLVRSAHLLTNSVQKIERTKPVASSLNKKDWCS